MAAPKGIFANPKLFPLSFLEDLAKSAAARIASGDFTNMSGSEKSHTLKYELPPDIVLVEVNYAIRLLQGNPRVSRTYSDMRRAQ